VISSLSINYLAIQCHVLSIVESMSSQQFDKCDLKLRYLHANNGLSADWDFETGIAKIQCGSERTMSQAEKRALRISELIPFRTVTMKQKTWWTVVKGITF